MRAPVGVVARVAAFALVAFAASPVRAGDLDTANKVFQQGRALMDAGRYAEACPLLEQAQRLVLGVGVTLYLADCYEQTGRPVPAWQEFDIARRLAESKHDARARVARERAERLWPKLPKLVLVVPPEADLAGLEVTEDGSALDRATYNVERPAVPGTHRFRAKAPDRAPWETSIEVPESAGTLRVEVPRLPEPQAAAPATVAPQSLAATRPAANGVPWLMDRPKPMPPQRIAGIAVFGVGAVSLTVSAVLGLQAKAKMDDSNSSGHCQSNDHCDATGLAERSSAITEATWSTVAAVGGVACLAGGAFLYLTARDAPPAPGVALAARPQRSGGSLLIEGTW